jgi:anti-sigma regulatory factor (Ser/Thr protein kinase)
MAGFRSTDRGHLSVGVGQREVSGVVTFLTAQQVPTSSTMAVPHGPAGVGVARRRMRKELLATGASDAAVDDAVLILSELLSNACRHARPLSADEDGASEVRAHWELDTGGRITVSVTDGGGATRPLPATPSVTARGGRGLAIIRRLARDWGVTYHPGEVTVWAELPRDAQALPAGGRRDGGLPGLDASL